MKQFAFESFALQDQDNGDDGPTAATVVWTSVDLLQEVLSYLVDETDSVLLEAHMLSKSFHLALLGDSDQIWKAACRHRWKSKWGFERRWQVALEGAAAVSVVNHDTSMTTTAAANRPRKSSQWWRYEYIWNERDGKRNSLRAEELVGLKFDFRFWLFEYFRGADDEYHVRTGLRTSIASNFEFLATGYLAGHPSNRDDLEWFLDDDGRGLQWGKMPHLWPKATVARLDDWGWEVRNPNVCLRAIDPSSTTGMMVDNSDHSDHRSHAGLANYEDLKAAIRRYRVELDDPDIIHIDVPPVFWEFLENRQRFPCTETSG